MTTGQYALSFYVAHILIGMGIMEAFGWLESGRALGFALLYSTAFYGAGMLFTWFWRKRYKRGPFEALMRRLTD